MDNSPVRITSQELLSDNCYLLKKYSLDLRRRPGTKHQDASRQVAVKRDDRVRLVKVASEPRQEGNP